MEKNMKTKGKVKPSKPVSFMQMIMGGIFSCIGLFVIIPIMAKINGPVWFGLIWTFVALAGAIIGAINLFSDEGIPTEEFSFTSDSKDSSQPRTAEQRLKDINDLRDKGLITEEEYKTKRAELLKEI
jgi:hypothetical protein